MKQRIISAVLTLCLCLSSQSVARAFPETPSLPGDIVTEETADGTVPVSPPLAVPEGSGSGTGSAANDSGNSHTDEPDSAPGTGTNDSGGSHTDGSDGAPGTGTNDGSGSHTDEPGGAPDSGTNDSGDSRTDEPDGAPGTGTNGSGDSRTDEPDGGNDARDDIHTEDPDGEDDGGTPSALQEDPALTADPNTAVPASITPRDITNLTPSGVYADMIALKDQEAYKEGTPWTDDTPYSGKNPYRWNGGQLGGQNIVATGCVAFAFRLSDEAFGNLKNRMYARGGFTFEDIKVGDILRMNTDTHTVIVLEVSDAGVVVAEGNYSGKVHWGRAITKEVVMNDTSHYITRYPEGYVSPDDETANESIGSGTLDAGIKWNLTKAGTLTISGKGNMPDYSTSANPPWYSNNDKIRKVVIENGITNIGSYAFYGCGVLSADIASSVTAIGNNAFYGSSILSVTIPSGVKTIGDSAFRECKSLGTVTVSEGVETISQNAFRACTGLAYINLPASIGEVGASAFMECTEMKYASFAPGSKQVMMGDNVFTRCYVLMGVTLPTSIDRIGEGMFQNCGMLTVVEIPQGADSIGLQAFASCSGLTTVVIPNSVKTIQTGAFSACPLKDIYFTGTEAEWTGIRTFGDMTAALKSVTKHYNFTPRSEPVTLKPGTQVPLQNDTLTYGEPLSRLTFGNAEFVDSAGKSVTGTLSWKDGSAVPDAGTASAAWVFTPDGILYAPAEGTAAITVNKAVPYIAALPTAGDIIFGNTLGSSSLSGGTVLYGDGAGQAGSGEGSTRPVAGSFAWKDPSLKPAMADSGSTEYGVVFTPSDTKNYETREGKITVTLRKGENAPNMPGNAMNVSASVKKVGDIPLPEGWAWQAADRDTLLEVGKTVTAVAVYTGADKGNYTIESVTVTITKSDCEHTAGDVLYTGTGEKAPTCTESGLGHRECSKCGAAVESGIVTDPLGHDYTSKVTKEPTADEEGVMTYTCSRCGHTYTSPIEKLPDNGGENPGEPGDDNKPGDDKPDDNKPGDDKPDDNKPGDDKPDDNKPGDDKPDNNKPGNNKPDNNKPDNSKPDNSKPGNGNTGQETRPDTGIPFIKNADGKFGWDAIRAEEAQAGDGSVIHVDMNSAAVVPGDIFSSIKGRNVTVAFDMGNGIVWTVDGRSVTADRIGDIDLSVRTGTNTIPADLISPVAGDRYRLQISLSHNGEFGFTAVLSINLGNENAGRAASLYYYNPGPRALELMRRETASEDGAVRFAFTHASEYLIVTDQKAGSGNTAVTAGTQNTAPKSGDQEQGILWWILIAGALTVILGICCQRKRNRQ